MVDIKQGQNKKIESSRLLVDFFSKNPQYNGKLYIGYPILYTGGENIILDAIWISQEKGIVIFDLVEGIELAERQEIRDILFNKVESELKSYNQLTERRKLLIDIEVVTFAPACQNNDLFDDFTANTENLEDILENKVANWKTFNEDILRKII